MALSSWQQPDQKPEEKASNELAGDPPSLLLHSSLVQINRELFKFGIVAVQPQAVEEEKTKMTTTSFMLGEREMVYHAHDENKQNKRQFPHSQLWGFSKDEELPTSFFQNKRRRDERFWGVPFANESSMYIYPWSSSGKMTQFNNFSHLDKQWVTAVCLLGTRIKAVDSKGEKKLFIKHGISFYPEQKIVAIQFNVNLKNPYTEMLFGELENLACLIDRFTIEGKSKELFCHLPYYDYMLFGIELFIRGRMTHKALVDFFAAILQEKDYYIERINQICQPHKIKVTIESPFKNLFGPLLEDKCCNDYKSLAGKTAAHIFKILDLKPETIDPTSISEPQQLVQKLVQKCFELLKKNTYDLEHQEVWKDFTSVGNRVIKIKVKNKDGSSFAKNKDGSFVTIPKPMSDFDIEDLFTFANAVVHGVVASRNTKKTTCVLLPATEKQISVSYGEFEELLEKPCYVPTANFTYLNTLIAYDYRKDHSGEVFYYNDDSAVGLGHLVADNKILRQAHRNAFFSSHYTMQNKIIPLTQALKLLPPEEKQGATNNIEIRKEHEKAPNNIEIQKEHEKAPELRMT